MRQGLRRITPSFTAMVMAMRRSRYDCAIDVRPPVPLSALACHCRTTVGVSVRSDELAAGQPVSVAESHRLASVFVRKVFGAARRTPSGPTYVARHLPEGRLADSSDAMSSARRHATCPRRVPAGCRVLAAM
jgi:hypothetical protein